MTWKRRDKSKWHAFFAVLPHHTMEGYMVWLSQAWRRRVYGISDGYFGTYGYYEYSSFCPQPQPPPRTPPRMPLLCLACDEPVEDTHNLLCAVCRKTISALRAIVQ